MRGEVQKKGIRRSRFPVSLFIVLFGVLLLMSGIHTGLIVWGNTGNVSQGIQILLPVIYWALVAGGLTLYTRYQMKKAYEIPMQTLADATSRVAHGDFSVFVPTINTPDKWDYLDIMIMDFNTMVEELGSMETLKTDFFSNVSHEIKTPLSVIYNNAQLLDREGISEEKRKECVKSILQSSKRLGDLIMNMLKLNKLEKQTIYPVPEEYDLCSQLCECALQFEDLWEKKEIDFEADLEERVMIEADAGLLELVWTNLLSNAIKFTSPGGAVMLKQTSDEDSVTVTVADNGCGMDEATKKHIFDKFYQGDISHAMEGNGLGLALVKRILQLSQGSISVESTIGQGSIFTVTLPRFRNRTVSAAEGNQEER
ncbi:MAG: ATP-binding protein [Enterocloster sp.]